MNHFIALAGNIGAGKTNFAKVLARRLGWEVNLEPVDENPYLHDFYRDMKSWAFHSQIFYLAKAVSTHSNLVKRQFSVVQDRSFYEHAEIFAKNLQAQDIFHERDWNTYRELYQASLAISTPPDLIIYLKGNTATLAERILRRGREAEKPLSLDYLERLNNLYDDWITRFNQCPSLTIPIENTDLRDNEAEQDMIIEKLWEILKNLPTTPAQQTLQLHTNENTTPMLSL